MIRTRFAPSPNGPLHLGHAYAAIVAHDRARAGGGTFLLRIEDIDRARSRPDHVATLLADLAWLGLDHDGEPVVQSRRVAAHRAAASRLHEMGILYPCTCSRAKVAAAATAMGPDGPVYPGTCRHSAKGRADPASEALVNWRLDMAAAAAMAGPLQWQDENAGTQRAEPGLFGDVVLLRRDLGTSYHLAVACDDAQDGISHVVRGRDLFAATHVHRLLQALLGLPVPVWHHHPLVVDAAGGKLAKSRGAPALAALRAAGACGRKLADELRAGRFPAGFALDRS